MRGVDSAKQMNLLEKPFFFLRLEIFLNIFFTCWKSFGNTQK